ncbi:hypothetical protein [Mucilaginibacter sp. UR6-11]|uniref:hypothetical protein n=1 Tax=Mucilaginibacter sp. UR6-11 TaxID=1435644 RepID=UPI001E591869|nr:hypothetical protein [Mucilaginibacter sp. UR6-11]MCC8424729.1 hypothetical protein [Mucilaginibacter sp. UR6-11]
MRDTLLLFRTTIAALMFCLLAWDGIQWLNLHTRPLPHRDLLLTGALLWLVSVFFPQNSDDDWAGQL